MSWTNIPNGNLAVGAPIRSVDQLALRDNPIAIAEGATGAPRVRAEALNGGQSGTAPIYAARAWVNFDGTTTTPTIGASGNVSSVTRNGTGDYTVNFTTAMADVNYSVTTGINPDTVGPANYAYAADPFVLNTNSCRIGTGFFTGTTNIAGNVSRIFVSLFR
jgi:hypothetical protein